MLQARQLHRRLQEEIIVDLILGALRVEDATLNQLALRACKVGGPPLLRELVRGAFDHTNALGHRLRIMQAIEWIGAVNDLGCYSELFTLLDDEDAEIRVAAKSVLGRLELEDLRLPS